MFNPTKCYDFALKDAEVIYYPHYFDVETSNRYFDILHEQTPWQHDDIKIFGKVYPQPRLTALYANNNTPYSYSNIVMKPHPFTPVLKEIKKHVEYVSKNQYTTCLLNLYRNGKDSNGWHADNEKELGENPVIASVSFGAQRAFHMKHRHDKTQKLKLNLEPGSLVIMRGTTQHYWLHQIPKTKKNIKERINLTFRILK